MVMERIKTNCLVIRAIGFLAGCHHVKLNAVEQNYITEEYITENILLKNIYTLHSYK